MHDPPDLIAMQQWSQIQILGEGGDVRRLIARKLYLTRRQWPSTRTAAARLDYAERIEKAGRLPVYLTERLADFPGMGAWVLSWEILAQGYEGGYERVKIACGCLRGDSSVDVVA